MKKSTKTKMIVGFCTTMALAFTVGIGQMIDVSAESTSLIEMRSGASVRISETESGTGIRFTADIDDSLVKTEVVEGVEQYSIQYTADVQEVGMIIVPAFALENVGGKDVFEYLKSTYGKEKAEISSTPNKVYKDKDGYYVAGAIVDILEENLAYEYQAIPYTYNGSSYAYGEASDKRTIHYVFEKALEEEKDPASRSKLLNKVVEMQNKLDLEDLLISNFDGYDLSKFSMADNADWEIVSVSVGSYSATPVDGALEPLALPWEAATKEDAQDLKIGYANGKSLTVDAKVWMKAFSSVEDFTMFDVSKLTAKPYGADSIGGYFGVTKDIAFNGETFDAQKLYANGEFTFDGNGFTLTNFNGCLTYSAKGVFKDVNFVNATAIAYRGIFANELAGGAKVQNVNMTVTLPSTTYGAAICASAVDLVSLENVNIVAKEAMKDGWSAGYNLGYRQGIIAARAYISKKQEFNCNNCTFVSNGNGDQLPLIGFQRNNQSNYMYLEHLGSAAYNALVTGDYKNYGYYELGAAAYDSSKEENSTASFRKFVADNNLATAWGPLGVTLIPVSDISGLKKMVASTSGYYYLTKNITFDATSWSDVTRTTSKSQILFEGNSCWIDGLSDYLFEAFIGRVQNLALTNIEKGGSIAKYVQIEGAVLNNIFLHGQVKESTAFGTGNAYGLVCQIDYGPITTENFVIYTTTSPFNQGMSGFIAGAGVAKYNASVACDNCVFISKYKPVTPYTQAGVFTTELEGADETKPYDAFLFNEYYCYESANDFEAKYTGALSEQNLKYYQNLINAQYGVVNE